MNHLKRRFKARAAGILALILVFAVSAPAAYAAAEDPAEQSEMYMNRADKILYLGESDISGTRAVYDFYIKNKPSNYSELYRFKWTSVRNRVATVDSKGLTTAVSTGTTTITCTITDKRTGEVVARTSAFVRVKQNADAVEITNYPKDRTVYVGDTINFNRNMSPKTDTGKATDKTRWVLTDNTAEAVVDLSNGKVTAQKAGSYTITAYTYQSSLYPLTMTEDGEYENYTAVSEPVTITVLEKDPDPLPTPTPSPEEPGYSYPTPVPTQAPSRPSDPTPTPVPVGPESPDDTVLVWRDAAFEQSIRNALGKASGDITVGDLKAFPSSELVLNNAAIQSIEDMKYFQELGLLNTVLQHVVVEGPLVQDASLLPDQVTVYFNGMSSVQDIIDACNVEELNAIPDLTLDIRNDDREWIYDETTFQNYFTEFEDMPLLAETFPGVKGLHGPSSISDSSVFRCWNGSSLSSLTVSSGLTEIEGLAGLTSLTYLDISNNAIQNLSPIGGLTSLKELYASWNQISTIDSLSALTSLKVLHVNDNLIRDITAVETMPHLTDINVNCNYIQDVSPLAHLASNDGVYMDLGYNEIRDLSPLKDFNETCSLIAYRNPVADYSAVEHFLTSGIYEEEYRLSADVLIAEVYADSEKYSVDRWGIRMQALSGSAFTITSDITGTELITHTLAEDTWSCTLPYSVPHEAWDEVPNTPRSYSCTVETPEGKVYAGTVVEGEQFDPWFLYTSISVDVIEPEILETFRVRYLNSQGEEVNPNEVVCRFSYAEEVVKKVTIIYVDTSYEDSEGGTGQTMTIDLDNKDLAASETVFSVRPDFDLEISVDNSNTFYEVDFTGRDVVEIVVD